MADFTVPKMETRTASESSTKKQSIWLNGKPMSDCINIVFTYIRYKTKTKYNQWQWLRSNNPIEWVGVWPIPLSYVNVCGLHQRGWRMGWEKKHILIYFRTLSMATFLGYITKYCKTVKQSMATILVHGSGFSITISYVLEQLLGLFITFLSPPSGLPSHGFTWEIAHCAAAIAVLATDAALMRFPSDELMSLHKGTGTISEVL